MQVESLCFAAAAVLALLLAFKALSCLLFGKKALHLDANSVILITGACRGIGRETAVLLGQRFHSVIVVFDIAKDLFEGLEKQLKNVGCTPLLYFCDLADEFQTSSAAAEVLKKFGKIDLLINNAGIVYGDLFVDADVKKIEHTMSVNFMGPIRMMKACLPKMMEQGAGHIVNVASVASFLYSQNLAAYSASKWALYAFHSSVRLELKISKSQIRTTLICPYLTETGMFEGYKPSFSWLFPPLKPAAVARRIVDSIIKRDELVIVPWIYSPLISLLNALPFGLLELAIRIMRILSRAPMMNNNLF